MSDIGQDRVALIGASGWLGRAFGPAMLRQGVVAPGHLIAANRSGAHPAYDDWPDLEWSTDPAAAAGRADIVILSVLPQDFRQMTLDCRDRLVLSFMAGVSCAEIADSTGAERIVRALPNAVAGIGRSYSPWFPTPQVTRRDRDVIAAILSSVGDADALPREEDLAAATILSGAGPAYAALLADALLQAARDHGLPEDIARKSVEAMICDAPAMMAGQIEGATQLVADYIDYGGTTAAALSAAQDAGFQDAVRAAVTAGIDRVNAMSRE